MPCAPTTYTLHPKTLDITKFVEMSIGSWRSQRSAHHMAFQQFEAVTSNLEIEAIATDDPEVIDLCKFHQIDPKAASSPFRMTWEGESDWDEDEELKGTTILVPVPEEPKKGKLLRDRGYAETMPSVGEYRINEDDVFVLLTPYDRAMAEEKIWFATPNLRFRVSLIKTSAGSGVITASFASEIRSLKT